MADWADRSAGQVMGEEIIDGSVGGWVNKFGIMSIIFCRVRVR